MIGARHGGAACLTALLTFVSVPPASAQARCEGPGAITVTAIDGSVSVRATDGTTRTLVLGDRVCPGEVVSAGDDGRVEIRFADKRTVVGVARNSTIRIPQSAATPAGGGSVGSGDVTLESGVLRFLSSVQSFFTVETRHANAGIDGTEAVVVTEEAAGTLVFVAEGDVTLADATGAALELDPGEAGFAGPGAEPRIARGPDDVPEAFRARILVPEQASDWAIHYPPILLARPSEDPTVVEAARLLEAGNPNAAEALLAGRQEADALALAAVVAVFRNRTEEGLELARRAVDADPGLGATHVAESYALQASGDVDDALASAERAAEVAPEDGFALARLAEMQLIAGDSPTAGKTAKRALRRAPSSLAHAVLGLSHLQANDYEAAQAAFDAGTEFDSEDPLPRLGAALLAIRRGDTEVGVREFELAASLDPRRAATRTLLGRAYAQNRMPDRALSQFELAQRTDPDDPAPWLEEAQTLFTLNRLVEAHRSLTRAGELGGSRAVLRSARGLGEDDAIRGAALGRVENTLGFEQRSIITAARATEQDPTNAAAHRTLADVLGSRENADQAQASSAFRAFVYSQPNTAPIKPSLQESDLALLNTPAATRPSFAELSPFFDQDGFRADISGFGGTQETRGDEVSFTAMAEGFQIGIGQFYYDTDGYRANNDVTHNVVTVQGKIQIAPVLDVFAEYRFRNTEAGDRTLEFDLANGDPSILLADERNLARVGAHARLGPNQDAAVVFTFVDTNDGTQFSPGGIGLATTTGGSDTFDLQAQHVGKFGPFTTTTGVAYTDFSGTLQPFFSFGGFAFPGPVIDADIDRLNAYTYVTWRTDGPGFLGDIELTGGVSVDQVDIDSPLPLSRTRVNPKVGALVEIIDGFVIRGALTRTVTPIQLVAERLEPVAVAGFNQYIDQFNNTEVWQGGVGADITVTDWLAVGADVLRRRIELPDPATLFDPEITEVEVNAYANMTVGDQVAVTLDFTHLDTEGGPGTSDLANFEVTEATAGASWFHPSGFFARGAAGVGWHDFTGINGTGDDVFPITELSLGYRLPDQRGIVSLDILNVVDADFGFEDRPIEGGVNPLGQPRFARDITVLGRVQLKF